MVVVVDVVVVVDNSGDVSGCGSGSGFGRRGGVSGNGSCGSVLIFIIYFSYKLNNDYCQSSNNGISSLTNSSSRLSLFLLIHFTTLSLHIPLTPIYLKT